MGWSAAAFDLADVNAVQEAVEWAELNMDKLLDQFDDGPYSDRVYVVYAKVPGDEVYLQLVGWDPANPYEDNLPRRTRRG